MLHYIYVLKDPRLEGVQAIRYVGAATDVKRRYGHHFADAKSGQPNARCIWLRELLAVDLRPELEIIDQTTEDERSARERHWVAHYRGLGCALLNYDQKAKTAEWRQKQGDRMREAWSDPNTRERITTAAVAGYTPEVRQRMRSATIERCADPKAKARLSIERQKLGPLRGARYKGISYSKEKGRWRASIRLCGVGTSLGCFDTEEEAAQAYDIAARMLFEPGCYLNFPTEEEAARMFAEAPTAALPPRNGQYKGVHLDTSKGMTRWHVRLRQNKKSVRVGIYHSQEEAARAYDAAAREAFGPGCYLNFPDEESA